MNQYQSGAEKRKKKQSNPRKYSKPKKCHAQMPSSSTFSDVNKYETEALPCKSDDEMSVIVNSLNLIRNLLDCRRLWPCVSLFYFRAGILYIFLHPLYIGTLCAKN